MNKIEKRTEADKILVNSNFSEEQKLFLISQLYKNDLMTQFPQLNYALLGWKDKHLKELRSKKVLDCLENMNM